MAVKVKQHKGAWWVFIDHKGKRKAKRVGASKRAAEQVAEKIQAKIALGQFEIVDEKTKRPFDEYFQNWMDTYARAHCKDSTVAGYEASFRLYLLPAFGQKDINEISRERVKTLAYDMLTQKKSRSYVKSTVAPLCEMFNHAIEDGHANVNPALRILRRNRTEEAEQKQKATALTREELMTLLTACQEHFSRPYPFVLLLARTGVRIGEAVALQWGDVDFHSRFLHVQRNWVDGVFTTPKNGKTRRVAVSRHLADTLSRLHVGRKKETLKNGWGDVPLWLFTNDAGNMLDPDNFRKRVWPKLLSKAGLRLLRIHDLRHTFASLLVQQGEPLPYVQAQMGHHSAGFTLQVYGHLLPSGDKRAVDRLDEAPEATNRNPDATSTLVAKVKKG